MRYISILLFFLCLQSLSYGQVHLKLQFPKMPDSWLYFAEVFGNNQYLIDSVLLDKKGKGVIEQEKFLPQGTYLLGDSSGQTLELLLNEDQVFELNGSSRQLKETKFSGSKENQLFHRYFAGISRFLHELDSLQYALELAEVEDREEIEEELTEARLSARQFQGQIFQEAKGTLFLQLVKGREMVALPDSLRRGERSGQHKFYLHHYFDNIDFTDPRILRSSVFHNKIDDYFSETVHPSPDSMVHYACHWIRRLEDYTPFQEYLMRYLFQIQHYSRRLGTDKVFVAVVDSFLKENRPNWLSEKMQATLIKRADLLRNSMIGVKGENLLLQDNKGDEFRLYDVEARFCMLFFWTPDCDHCKAAMPEVYASYEKYRKKGLELVAIYTEKNEQEWHNYIVEHKLNWTNVYDPGGKSGMLEKYNVFMTPTIYILDSEKKIILKDIDASQVPMVLEALYK